MKFRKIKLESGTHLLLGKNAGQNEELVEEFKAKDNVIMHTAEPGSPFCVIDNLKPTNKDMIASGAICAGYSQDWRDNKSDVIVHIFTGKDIRKRKGMKVGTFGVKKFKKIKVKKEHIQKWKK